MSNAVQKPETSHTLYVTFFDQPVPTNMSLYRMGKKNRLDVDTSKADPMLSLGLSGQLMSSATYLGGCYFGRMVTEPGEIVWVAWPYHGGKPKFVPIKTYKKVADKLLCSGAEFAQSLIMQELFALTKGTGETDLSASEVVLVQLKELGDMGVGASTSHVTHSEEGFVVHAAMPDGSLLFLTPTGPKVQTRTASQEGVVFTKTDRLEVLMPVGSA
ncbi:MAG: hypothetical protein WAX89_04170 [Alphaproteobacteria bacterium]